MKKVSSILLTITASAVLASVPAVAQLGGALGSTLGGGAQAQGGRGGLGGGLGVDHTLNGTMQGRGRGMGGDLGLGSDSTLDGATQVTRNKKKDKGQVGAPLGDVTHATKQTDEKGKAPLAGTLNGTADAATSTKATGQTGTSTAVDAVANAGTN